MQIRARAKLLQNKPFSTITRFARLLDNAALKSATPPTWSPRFDAFGSNRPVEGVLHWGGTLRWLHNKLMVSSLRIVTPRPSAADFLYGPELNVLPSMLDWTEQSRYFRWFKHDATFSANGYVAFQEYIRNSSDDAHSMVYAVFEASSGKEIQSHGIVQPSNIDSIIDKLNDLPPVNTPDPIK